MARTDDRAGRRRAWATLALAGLSAALAGSPPTPAAPGAWTRSPGETQVIAAYSQGLPPMSTLVRSAPADTPVDSQTSFVSLYAEHGLAEGLTLGATAFVEIPEGEGADHAASLGVLLRKRLWQRAAGDVASVQVGYVQPLDAFLGPRFGGRFASETHEASLRAQYGRGFRGDWGSAFVSLEGGFHHRFGDGDAVRLDLTAGYAPRTCCMPMLSLFSTLPLGDEAAQLKLVPSFAYTFEGDEGEGLGLTPVTLHLSLSQDVLNPDDGLGVQIGVWKTF